LRWRSTAEADLTGAPAVPSGAAEVLDDELGIDSKNTAKRLHEHRQAPARRALTNAIAVSSRDVGPNLKAAAEHDHVAFHIM
jgi:hypothetical protein